MRERTMGKGRAEATRCYACATQRPACAGKPNEVGDVGDAESALKIPVSAVQLRPWAQRNSAKSMGCGTRPDVPTSLPSPRNAGVCGRNCGRCCGRCRVPAGVSCAIDFCGGVFSGFGEGSVSRSGPLGSPRESWMTSAGVRRGPVGGGEAHVGVCRGGGRAEHRGARGCAALQAAGRRWMTGRWGRPSW